MRSKLYASIDPTSIGSVVANLEKAIVEDVDVHGVIHKSLKFPQSQATAELLPGTEIRTAPIGFDTYIAWSLLSGGYTFSIQLVDSNETPTYATIAMNDNILSMLHGIWYVSGVYQDTWQAWRINTSPALPANFEITGTIHMVCNDGIVAGQGVGALPAFFGFSDNTDIDLASALAGINIVVSSQYMNVYARTTNSTGTTISLAQPFDVTLNYTMRKDAGGWYVEVTDGQTVSSATGAFATDPNIFLARLTETLADLPINERVNTDIEINITAL